MKINPFFKILSLFLVVAFTSCSKSEDPIKPVQEELSLVLKSDVGSGDPEVITVDTMVTFTVTGSDGEDYTASSKLSVNDTEIQGNTYTFTASGSYTVKAVYQSISSNTLNFEVLEPTQRALTIDVPKALRNQTITFGLIDSNGDNTASEATFYVNDAAISGFTYVSANTGSFVVYAEYEVNGEIYTTEKKPFEVFIPKRKVVLEDYTGAWCGYCPAVALAVDTARTKTPHISVVAIHESAFSFPDPMEFPQIKEMKAHFGIGGLPQARLNRIQKWIDPYPMNDILTMAGKDNNISIAINSQLTGLNLSVDVKLVSETGLEAGDKLVVYLTESGIIYPQINYFNNVPGHPLNGAGNPIPEFEHNDVLRNSFTNIYGDNIPATPAFQVYPKNYTLTIPSDYVTKNLSIVVMVVNSEDSAKNSQFSKVGENKNYE